MRSSVLLFCHCWLVFVYNRVIDINCDLWSCIERIGVRVLIVIAVCVRQSCFISLSQCVHRTSSFIFYLHNGYPGRLARYQVALLEPCSPFILKHCFRCTFFEALFSFGAVFSKRFFLSTSFFRGIALAVRDSYTIFSITRHLLTRRCEFPSGRFRWSPESMSKGTTFAQHIDTRCAYTISTQFNDRLNHWNCLPYFLLCATSFHCAHGASATHLNVRRKKKRERR